MKIGSLDARYLRFIDNPNKNGPAKSRDYVPPVQTGIHGFSVQIGTINVGGCLLNPLAVVVGSHFTNCSGDRQIFSQVKGRLKIPTEVYVQLGWWLTMEQRLVHIPR